MAGDQKVTIEMPEWVANLTLAERKEIGDAIVEFIKDRTEQGVGVRKHGDHWRTYNFPSYEPEYEAEKGSSRVDLRLSSEMLDELSAFNVKGNTLEVGYRGNAKLLGKVEGNRIGSYGGDPNPRKARDFLGMTKAELDAVLAPYKEKAK